jgi:hypothetical protein
MSSRNLLAFTLAGLLAAGIIGIAPVANATAASQAFLKHGERASDLVEIKHRGRGQPLYLPIGPNYLAYDYPYYYRRGFYPTHIGPGYVYYGHPYSYYRTGYGRRCSYRQRRCLAGIPASRRQWGACRCP